MTLSQWRLVPENACLTFNLVLFKKITYTINAMRERKFKYFSNAEWILKNYADHNNKVLLVKIVKKWYLPRVLNSQPYKPNSEQNLVRFRSCSNKGDSTLVIIFGKSVNSTFLKTIPDGSFELTVWFKANMYTNIIYKHIQYARGILYYKRSISRLKNANPARRWP